MQGKNWVFTLNNPWDEMLPRAWIESSDNHVVYAVWQMEEAPGTGTVHLQGYVRMSQTCRMAALKKLCAEAHWEVRKGTHEQARAYCLKEDSRIFGPWELPEPMPELQPGKRSDLDAVKESLQGGCSLAEVADEHFGTFIRYSRGIREYMGLQAPAERGECVTRVFYGPPGSGKSRRAVHECGDEPYYMLAPPNQNTGAIWWDGYNGEKNLIIDEFYGWINHSFLCRILDRYPLMVQTKGGMVPLQANRVWITSNKQPEDWFPRTGLGALERRIRGGENDTIYMGGSWQPGPLVSWADEVIAMADALDPAEEAGFADYMEMNM